jgi:hypothetical protein
MEGGERRERRAVRAEAGFGEVWVNKRRRQGFVASLGAGCIMLRSHRLQGLLSQAPDT